MAKAHTHGVRASDPAERRRSAIVPLSLLRDEDGQLTAPRWVLQRCLRNPSEQVSGGAWAGVEAVRAQLQAALGAILAGTVQRAFT